MNCVNCGASLPPHSDRCSYCGSLNDTDLPRLGAAAAAWDTPAGKNCPRCNRELLGLRLEVGQNQVAVNRCSECLGMFFGANRELEKLLHDTIPHMAEPDYRRLIALAIEGRREDWPVIYIPCPVCGQRMNRKLYGTGSGVVVDWCRDHGIWLDGGELGMLVRWARAGGLARDLEAKKREAVALPKSGGREERFGAQRLKMAFDLSLDTSSYADDPVLAILRSIGEWLKR